MLPSCRATHRPHTAPLAPPLEAGRAAILSTMCFRPMSCRTGTFCALHSAVLGARGILGHKLLAKRSRVCCRTAARLQHTHTLSGTAVRRVSRQPSWGTFRLACNWVWIFLLIFDITQILRVLAINTQRDISACTRRTVAAKRRQLWP